MRYIICYDKYGFPGIFEYPAAKIRPLQVLPCMMVTKVPITVRDITGNDTELWITADDYELRESLDMVSAISAGEMLEQQYSPGMIVTFGHYEQDNQNNGTEPIEWVALDLRKDKVLLVSRYALDCMDYHDSNIDMTWEDCALRSWLNNDFYNAAFSDEEKERVKLTLVDNSTSQGAYSTDGGNDTKDYVFNLSYHELITYFADDNSRICEQTTYTASKCRYIRDGKVIWLSRSPGESPSTVIRIGNAGDLYGYNFTNDGYGDHICVRPAIWMF